MNSNTSIFDTIYNFRIAILVILLISACGFSYWMYYDTFKNTLISEDPSHWGTFGDYIGGVSGTLFSVISVIFLYLTITKQAKYAITQQFEPSFFNLITNQREIRKSLSGYVFIDYGDDSGLDKDVDGDEYIEALCEALEEELKRTGDLGSQESVDKAYGIIFRGQESRLGHYFRHLYHIVKYTHESEVPDKKKYIDILQAQMSDDELYLAFYNAIYKHGREKFLPLLDEYGFFENIRSRSKSFDVHKKAFFPKTKFKHDSNAELSTLASI